MDDKAGLKLSKFQLEYRADYNVSLFDEGIDIYLRTQHQQMDSPPIWMHSWILLDKAAKQKTRDQAVTEYEKGRGYKETNPHDPQADH